MASKNFEDKNLRMFLNELNDEDAENKNNFLGMQEINNDDESRYK